MSISMFTNSELSCHDSFRNPHPFPVLLSLNFLSGREDFSQINPQMSQIKRIGREAGNHDFLAFFICVHLRYLWMILFWLRQSAALWGGLSSPPRMAGRDACPTEGRVRGFCSFFSPHVARFAPQEQF
jgi:hypothetical protein